MLPARPPNGRERRGTKAFLGKAATVVFLVSQASGGCNAETNGNYRHAWLTSKFCHIKDLQAKSWAKTLS